MQAQAFYREVAAARALWTIRDDGGYPAPIGSGGKRAMPFWSSESRALTVIRRVAAYKEFVPVRIDWDSFCSRWLPRLLQDKMRAGVNWSGSRASGYDVDPRKLKENVEAASVLYRGPHSHTRH
jgi:hypothetical protein